MSRGLDGTNPAAYLGVRPLTPPNMIIPGIRPSSQPRDPTQNDIQYNLGDHWLNTATLDLWYLAALGSHLVGGINTRFATWLKFSTGDDELETLTGDVGGPVGPDANKNINTLGTAGHIVVTGNPGTFTLTWDLDGSIADSYPTDSGTAIPAANVLNIITNNAAIEAGASVLFTGVGNTVQLHVTDADSNTLVGTNAGNLTLSGAGNSALGAGSLNNLTTGDANSALGVNSLQLLTTGENNTAIGDLALSDITTGDNNTALGQDAGSSYTGAESDNIVIGQGITGVLGESNVLRIGTNVNGTAGTQTKTYISACYSNFGTDNTFVGAGAANTTLSGANNASLGSLTLTDLTTGFNNIAVGFGACDQVTSGSNNIGIGVNACEPITTGQANIGIGNGTLQCVTGVGNTVVGHNASAGIGHDGDENSVYGHNAASTYVGAESNNVIIHNVGVVGESNNIRIGSNGGLITANAKCFIAGIRGVTTDVNDAIAVLIDSAGQLGTVSSSLRFKENVEDMGDYSSPILDLRPVTFNYKNRSSERKSVGLIAEEVGEVMPDLVVFDNQGLAETVRYNDLVPLLLNEVQKQKVEIDKLHSLVVELEKSASRTN